MLNKLIGSAALLLGSAVASNATPTINIYGSYTDSVTNWTTGDNPPNIVNNGLQNTNYFNVDNLVYGGAASVATSGGGLLFSVDPARRLKPGGGTGTETATINVNFSFYNSSGGLLGTASDSALATFIYGPNTDNLCWSNTAVTGTAFVSHGLSGSCGLPGSGTPDTAYEQILVHLGTNFFDVDLFDWNDWNEQPQIKFAWSDPPPGKVPEPITLSLFGAGLVGAAAMRHRRRASKA